jgi:hypothetical protein
MPPGPRGRQADAEPSGVLGVAAGGEGRRLLVPHLHELQLVLVRMQGFEDAVDAVSGKAKDGVHAPLLQPLDQQLGYVHCHRGVSLSWFRVCCIEFPQSARQTDGPALASRLKCCSVANG